MTLTHQTVTIALSDDAREALERVAANVPESLALTVEVEGTDDLGIWVRLERKDGWHLVLVRWEYVLAVDVLAGVPRSIGLKG